MRPKTDGGRCEAIEERGNRGSTGAAKETAAAAAAATETEKERISRGSKREYEPIEGQGEAGSG